MTPGRPGPRGTLGWVLLAWVLGVAVAVLAYTAGPDRLVWLVLDAAAGLGDALGRAVRLFGALTLDLVRGLAVGALATFVVLCLVALRRGLRAGAALAVVTSLWCLLVVVGGEDASQERWAGALLLAAVGALVVTRRILSHAAAGPPPRT